MLADLGVRSVSLLTNNPLKVEGLQAEGVIVRRVPHLVHTLGPARSYLEVKSRRMGHILELDGVTFVAAK